MASVIAQTLPSRWAHHPHRLKHERQLVPLIVARGSGNVRAARSASSSEFATCGVTQGRRAQRKLLRCEASYPARTGGGGSSLGPRGGALGAAAGNGVFILMLLCCVAFVGDTLLHLPGTAALHLNHARPQWWQFITHMFCHANFAHLSGNLFNLCVFGKMVEDTEGAGGVALAFLICGLGAAVATFLLTPSTINGHATVSVGASGAIFGLFAVSVGTRLRWNLKQLLEAAVLGQFVVRQVLEEAKHQVTGGLVLGGLAVSHVAHLAGAAVGVLLVLALQRLPEPGAGSGGGAAAA